MRKAFDEDNMLIDARAIGTELMPVWMPREPWSEVGQWQQTPQDGPVHCVFDDSRAPFSGGLVIVTNVSGFLDLPEGVTPLLKIGSVERAHKAMRQVHTIPCQLYCAVKPKVNRYVFSSSMHLLLEDQQRVLHGEVEIFGTLPREWQEPWHIAASGVCYLPRMKTAYSGEEPNAPMIESKSASPPDASIEG